MISVDLVANEGAHSNIVLSAADSWEDQRRKVSEEVGSVLSGQKLDGVVCVAGGWAGGSIGSDGGSLWLVRRLRAGAAWGWTGQRTGYGATGAKVALLASQMPWMSLSDNCRPHPQHRADVETERVDICHRRQRRRNLPW